MTTTTLEGGEKANHKAVRGKTQIKGTSNAPGEPISC